MSAFDPKRTSADTCLGISKLRSRLNSIAGFLLRYCRLNLSGLTFPTMCSREDTMKRKLARILAITVALGALTLATDVSWSKGGGGGGHGGGGHGGGGPGGGGDAGDHGGGHGGGHWAGHRGGGHGGGHWAGHRGGGHG